MPATQELPPPQAGQICVGTSEDSPLHVVPNRHTRLHTQGLHNAFFPAATGGVYTPGRFESFSLGLHSQWLPLPPHLSRSIRLSQNGVDLVVSMPSSARRLLHPLSLGAGRKAGRAPLRAREPCPQSPGRLLQNHSAAHCLQGRLDLLGLGLGHVGFDFLRQGFHQLLCLPESKVRTQSGPGSA